MGEGYLWIYTSRKSYLKKKRKKNFIKSFINNFIEVYFYIIKFISSVQLNEIW